jgi:hypothetical protein
MGWHYRCSHPWGLSVLDNQLIAIIISTIIAGEATAGISNTPIKQAFQPTNQGVNVKPTAYIFKVGDRRVGFPYRNDTYDSIAGAFDHEELQQYETTFQISALSTQNPANTTQYTASDILNLIAYILQSDMTINSLIAQGIGILRIESIRNPYFFDDRERNEALPSLDFTLTHKQIITSSVPVVITADYNIIPI